MAHTFENIRLTGYQLEKIEKIIIEAKVNEHTTLKLQATLQENQQENPIHTTGQEKYIKLYTEVSGKETTLFNGVVTWIQVQVVAGVYQLQLEAKSGTYLMDITKCSRSFQDIHMTYHQLIKEIVGDYDKADCIIEVPDEPIGQLFIQYEETDWAFLKRITSNFYEGLIPGVEHEGIRFWVGVPEVKKQKIPVHRQQIKKDLKTYYTMKSSGLKAVLETEYISYWIESEGLLNLGNHIEFKGRKFYVKTVEARMDKGIWQNTYELRIKKGLKQPKIYGLHLVGVGIEGKILASQGSKVKVHLKIDKKQAINKAYWFPYSTISASNDGSGWYCMPEIGDIVRVYFPTKKNKDTFAISAVSQYTVPSGGNKDRMSSPDTKYLRTVHDKQVKLTPEGIKIACNGSVSTIRLSSNGNISLYGNKSISAKAEENIDIKVKEDLCMTAMESITFACDKAGKVVLDDAGNIVIQGTEVKID